jgi:hypothetical protein
VPARTTLSDGGGAAVRGRRCGTNVRAGVEPQRRRELRFHGADDVAANIPALELVVRDWVGLLYPRATGTNR